jgi:hypothetical protein
MSAPTRPAAGPEPELRDPATDHLPTSIGVGDVDVTIVRWPEEASVRDVLSLLGRPRLLLVEPGFQPPDPLELEEDWLRWPPDPGELLLRAKTLGQRVPPAHEPDPVVDGDGILRRGDRWLAISPAQLPVLRLLLDHVDEVVRFDDIVDAYASSGGSRLPASVRTVVSRLEARIAPLGLEVVTIRGRGVMLRSAGGRALL